MTAATGDDWLDLFPALRGLNAEAKRVIRASARPVTLPSGAAVFHEGTPCSNYLLVLEGSVRVQKVAANGREILLYRVGPGETCVLTTVCLIGRQDYGAEGVTEAAVRAMALPDDCFQRLLADSPGFRGFVFDAFSRRLLDLMLLIDEVVFGRIDVRLARYLLDQRDDRDGLDTTHQALAADLGTAREVISRQLKEFERRGWLALQRGRIELRNTEGLQALAAQISL